MISQTSSYPLSLPLSFHALGGGYLTNVYTGRLRSEVQPLTLLYTIFHEKGTPLLWQ